MTIKNLYKYKENESTVTSLNEPDCEHIIMYRLVAGEGKALTQDGETSFSCIDTYSTDGWYEIDAEENETDIPDSEALSIITGGAP